MVLESSAEVLRANNWHNVILTYDTSTGINLFLDGVAVASNNDTIDITPTGLLQNIVIGSNITANFDEVKLYDKILNPDEIQHLAFDGNYSKNINNTLYDLKFNELSHVPTEVVDDKTKALYSAANVVYDDGFVAGSRSIRMENGGYVVLTESSGAAYSGVSISAWINLDTLSNTNQHILKKAGVIDFAVNTNSLSLTLGETSMTFVDIIPSPPMLNDEKFHFHDPTTTFGGARLETIVNPNFYSNKLTLSTWVKNDPAITTQQNIISIGDRLHIGLNANKSIGCKVDTINSTTTVVYDLTTFVIQNANYSGDVFSGIAVSQNTLAFDVAAPNANTKFKLKRISFLSPFRNSTPKTLNIIGVNGVVETPLLSNYAIAYKNQNFVYDIMIANTSALVINEKIKITFAGSGVIKIKDVDIEGEIDETIGVTIVSVEKTLTIYGQVSRQGTLFIYSDNMNRTAGNMLASGIVNSNFGFSITFTDSRSDGIYEYFLSLDNIDYKNLNLTAEIKVITQADINRILRVYGNGSDIIPSNTTFTAITDTTTQTAPHKSLQQGVDALNISDDFFNTVTRAYIPYTSGFEKNTIKVDCDLLHIASGRPYPSHRFIGILSHEFYKFDYATENLAYFVKKQNGWSFGLHENTNAYGNSTTTLQINVLQNSSLTRYFTSANIPYGTWVNVGLEITPTSVKLRINNATPETFTRTLSDFSQGGLILGANQYTNYENSAKYINNLNIYNTSQSTTNPIYSWSSNSPNANTNYRYPFRSFKPIPTNSIKLTTENPAVTFNNVSISPGTGLTVAFWFYWDSYTPLGNNNYTMLCSSTNSINAAYNFGISIHKVVVTLYATSHSFNRIRLNLPNFTNQDRVDYFSMDTIMPKTWTHVALKINAKETAIFINGNMSTSIENLHTNHFLSNINNALAVSSIQLGSSTESNKFNGLINCFQVFKKPLHNNEIYQLFNKDHDLTYFNQFLHNDSQYKPAKHMSMSRTFDQLNAIVDVHLNDTTTSVTTHKYPAKLLNGNPYPNYEILPTLSTDTRNRKSGRPVMNYKVQNFPNFQTDNNLFGSSKQPTGTSMFWIYMPAYSTNLLSLLQVAISGGGYIKTSEGSSTGYTFSAIPLNTWTHVAFRINGFNNTHVQDSVGNNRMSIFINGVNQYNNPYNGASTTFSIANEAVSFAEFGYTGHVYSWLSDSCRIYAQALSDNEIYTIFMNEYVAPTITQILSLQISAGSVDTNVLAQNTTLTGTVDSSVKKVGNSSYKSLRYTFPCDLTTNTLLSDDFTISFWIKKDPTTTAVQKVLGTPNFNTATRYGFGLYTDQLWIHTGTGFMTLSCNLHATAWNRVTFVKSVSSATYTYTLYCSNDVITTLISNTSSHAVNTNDTQLIFGGSSTQSGASFTGHTDDVRVYNYALTENQIIALHS